MAIREELLDLLRTDVAFREEVRRQLLTEEVLTLPAMVRTLVEAQHRTEVQVQRQGEQIQQLSAEVQRQGEQIRLLVQQVQELVSWQRGEAGRRSGERYEGEIVRRAPALFNGGQGGSPAQPVVQQRLTEQLGALLSQEILSAEVDPFLADLLWWKGGQVAVVEVSVQVNGEDIRRAVQRAATLRQAGAAALPVVIGEDWATWEARDRAQLARVEWKVGADFSEGFLAFRRLPAT